jgi:energy-coupling factor transporter ATP-binding protein EcfA2
MKPERTTRPLTQTSALLTGSDADTASANPFVGLRPFESEESLLFFGRREQAIELLQRLHATHFLAVVGSSGCGKSSLVRAGLIPKLKAGFLVEERDVWRVATMKPGDAPLENMAISLLDAVGVESSKANINETVEAMNGEGAQAIITRLQTTLGSEDSNLLLLVDQFEELFRFALRDDDPVKRNEAEEFVALLLELAAQRDFPVFVVTTMRSDFIGDCDNFFGLPEAMNRSQYLVPRLTRRQRQEAIEGPIRLFGARINQRLLDRVLNDAGDKSDQLPVMQHALMRTWEDWQQSREDAIDVQHYENVGTINEALSKDAEQALAGLSADETKIAERMFQALTDTDARGRRIRRPARLSEIEAITNATREQLLAIVERFRGNRRNFVNVYEDKLSGDVTIDISHESLIRQWGRLGDWVTAETDSRRTYLRITDAAVMYREGRAKLLRNPQLAYALNWRAQNQPTRIWAARYNADFDTAMAFLDKSRRHHQVKSIALYVLIPVLVIGWAGAYTLVKNYRLTIEAERKDELRHIAETQREQAEEQRDKQEEALAKQYVKLIDIMDDYYAGKIVIYPEPIVGNIRLQRLDGDRIKFFDNWIDKNLIDVDVPELREIAHPVSGPIKFNHRAAADLQAAFREIKARGLLNLVLTWDRGVVDPDSPEIHDLIGGAGGGPSPHILGIGFDINSEYNQRNRPAAPKGQYGSVIDLVAVLREFGFGWGGDHDGRHFEYIRPDTSILDNPTNNAENPVKE